MAVVMDADQPHALRSGPSYIEEGLRKGISCGARIWCRYYLSFGVLADLTFLFHWYTAGRSGAAVGAMHHNVLPLRAQPVLECRPALSGDLGQRPSRAIPILILPPLRLIFERVLVVRWEALDLVLRQRNVEISFMHGCELRKPLRWDHELLALEPSSCVHHHVLYITRAVVKNDIIDLSELLIPRAVHA